MFVSQSRSVRRPTKYDAKFHNEDFLRLAAQGKTIIQIAAEWDVDRDTIAEWGKKHAEFSGTLKRGKALSEAWYVNVGQKALQGNPDNIHLGFYVWLTKNLFKWSDKVEEMPTQKKKRPLKNVSDQELDEM